MRISDWSSDVCSSDLREGLHLAVDRRDRITGAEANAVFLIPGVVVDDDVLERLLARQQRRKHDAVVLPPRFHAEYGDAIAAAYALQPSLHRPPASPPLASHAPMIAAVDFA